MAIKDPVITIKAKNNTKRAFGAVRKSLQGMKGAVFNLKSGLVALAGAAGFGLAVKESFKTTDALAKQADQMGINTKQLAGLKHALDITTDGTVNIQKAVLSMSGTIVDAGAGLKTYTRVYDELGLNVKELEALDPANQFIEISEALNALENQTRKNALAADIFGARNAQLVNTAKLGREGLEAMSKEAEALGLAVNRVDAAKIEAANDSFTRMKGVISGVANRIAVALAPFLAAISDHLVEASINSEGFKDTITGAIRTTITAVGFLGDVFRGLEFVWKGLQVAFLSLVSFTINKIADLDQVMTDILNKIPGVSADVEQNILFLAEGVGEKLLLLRQELDTLVLAPLPSQNIDAFFDNIETRATRAAQVVAVRAGQTIAVEKKMGDTLVKDGAKSGKKQFQLSKELTTALTIADAPAAISGAYKVGAGIGGPVLGGIYAASAALFTARQIASARGLSFGGGGGGGGAGGGATTAPAVEQPLSDFSAPTDQQRAVDVSITVDGTGKLDRDQAEEIAQSVADLINDGFQPT